MGFKIDWASLTVGSKCTVFALFYFVFEGNFSSTSPLGGAIFGGAYFRDFTVYDERSYLNRRNTTVPNRRIGENPGNKSSAPRLNIWKTGLI